jgi:hypothetical protein
MSSPAQPEPEPEPEPDAEPIVREALRLCDRYVSEVVLAFGLCPWAEGALRGGRVRRAVCAAAAPAPADCLRFIDGADAGAEVEIALVVFPRLAAGWGAFDAFAERVRRADRARRPVGAAATFLIAAFHPDGVTHAASPHQLVSLLRRTPDPMLQLVRASTLDRLKAACPHASDDVARRNFEAMGAPGAAARLEAALGAIRADRDRTYAALGL